MREANPHRIASDEGYLTAIALERIKNIAVLVDIGVGGTPITAQLCRRLAPLAGPIP
jgi:hypothetical protein